jgi:hypothetical protein
MGKRSTCSSWGRRLLVSLVDTLGSTDHSEWRQIQGRGQQRRPRWGWWGGGHGHLEEEEEMVGAPREIQGVPAPVEGLGIVGQGRGRHRPTGHQPTLLLARYAREAALGETRWHGSLELLRWQRKGEDARRESDGVGASAGKWRGRKTTGDLEGYRGHGLPGDWLTWRRGALA